jgi:hypothetical protein
LTFKNVDSVWWKYYVLMYENGKMRLFQEREGGRIKENDGGLNSTTI